jgi:hypothetical protein
VALVLVVLVVWTLAAFVALLFGGALCAAAARGDAADRGRRTRRPAGVPERVVVLPRHSVQPSDAPKSLVRR